MTLERLLDRAPGLPVVDGADPGPAPVLQWIPIADLVVDPRYQRPLKDKSRRAIRRIAERFNWSLFSAVVVAPVEGGKYAVIDGQHRSIAASLRGIEAVPAEIVVADVRQQAASFASINGDVTKVHVLARHRAEVAAGDADALAVVDVCARAGASVAPYAKADLEPGETMAIGALKRCLALYGRDTLVTALQCITQTSNCLPGALSSVTINGLCDLLHYNRDWRDAGEALLAACDEVDFLSIMDELRGTGRKQQFIDAARLQIGRALEKRLAA